MRISQRGIDLIVKYEGLIPYVYNDPVGHATFGVGHLLHTGGYTKGDAAEWGTKWTPRVGARSRAMNVLRRDLKPREAAIRRLVKVPLNQCEFDALVSLVFNIGEGGFASSSVLRELNRGRRFRAGLAFLMWDKAGGQRLLGLTRRRNSERRLFRSKRCRNKRRTRP